jgi:hypothetical protein
MNAFIWLIEAYVYFKTAYLMPQTLAERPFAEDADEWYEPVHISRRVALPTDKAVADSILNLIRDGNFDFFMEGECLDPTDKVYSLVLNFYDTDDTDQLYIRVYHYCNLDDCFVKEVFVEGLMPKRRMPTSIKAIILSAEEQIYFYDY